MNSIEISNFKNFRHLRIDNIGRVNLIVGKNNAGKSSLLEAVSILAPSGRTFLGMAFTPERLMTGGRQRPRTRSLRQQSSGWMRRRAAMNVSTSSRVL